MKQQALEQVYEKMTTTPEMDERILNRMRGKRKQTKRVSLMLAGSLVAAAFAVVCVLQVPSVSANARNLLASFKNVLHMGEETVEMDGEYIHINKEGTDKDAKYQTMTEIEDLLGVSLVKSSNAYETSENLFTYTPYLTKSGEVYGAIIQDNFYGVGDLKNIKVKTFDTFDTNNEIQYRIGENYKSPIAMHITIRTDQSLGADYYNGELAYAGNEWNLDSDELSTAETYKIESLDVKAVLYSTKTDGIITWMPQDYQVEQMTSAMFVYEGIEYEYCGDVSIDVMEEFLESLNY